MEWHHGDVEPKPPRAVREDCRHYIGRSTAGGERIEKCRLSVNTDNPFGCPEGCLFFEGRSISSAGWHVPDSDK